MTFTFKLLAILARAAMPPGQCGCLPCAHFPAEGVYVERQDDYVYVVALDEYRLPNLKVLTTYEYEAVIGTIPQLDDCSFHSSHVLPTTECPPLYTPDVLTIAEDNSPCRFDVASKPSPLATPMNATPTNIVPIDALSVAEDDSPCVALSIPRPPASPKRAAATPKKATKSPKVVSSAKISRSKLRQSFSRSKGAILQRKTSSSSVSLPGSASDTSVIVLKQSMLRAKTSEQDKRKIQYWAIMSVIYEVLVTKICTPWAAILQNLLFPDKSAATIENWFNNRHQNWGPIDPNPEIQNVVFDRVNAKAPGKVEQITMTMRLTALKWSTSWTDEEFVTFLKEEIIPNQDRIIEEYLHKADTIPGYENRQNFSKVVDAIGSEEEREYKFIPELNSTLLVTRRVPTAAAMPTFVFR